MNDRSAAELAPPDEIVVRWCPVCGRNDRDGHSAPFAEGDWHLRSAPENGMVSGSWRAERCNGIPIKVRYERSVAA